MDIFVLLEDHNLITLYIHLHIVSQNYNKSIDEYLELMILITNAQGLIIVLDFSHLKNNDLQSAIRN